MTRGSKYINIPKSCSLNRSCFAALESGYYVPLAYLLSRLAYFFLLDELTGRVVLSDLIRKLTSGDRTTLISALMGDPDDFRGDLDKIFIQYILWDIAFSMMNGDFDINDVGYPIDHLHSIFTLYSTESNLSSTQGS